MDLAQAAELADQYAQTGNDTALWLGTAQTVVSDRHFGVNTQIIRRSNGGGADITLGG